MFKYDFFLRDFRKCTGHLDFIHRAAYRELLDSYYDREDALPGNPGLCHRLTGCQTQEERQAVENVIREFFTLAADGKFHNARADEEIAKYRQFIEKQKENGKKGGRPAKPTGLGLVNPGHNPNETLSSTSSSTSSSPSSSTPSSTEVDTPPSPPGGCGGGEEMTSEFLQCYSDYPRHEDRRDAWKAWQAAKRSGRLPEVETIRLAIAAQKRGRKWRDGFVKSFGSWIRKDCWADEVVEDDNTQMSEAGRATMESTDVLRQKLVERGEIEGA